MDFKEKMATTIQTRDPHHVGAKITLVFPIVALDLTYDDDQKSHLVFEARSLMVNIFNRPFDLQILLDLSELSIQDSKRNSAQRYLASTPNLNENLIHIDYVNIQNKKSPLYKDHGAELMVEFSELKLDIDTTTLMHLRPFIVVLLHR